MKKVAVFYYLKIVNESGDFHQLKIKEYKDKNDNRSTIFFSFYQGMVGFSRYFSEGEFFQDEKHLERDKIVCFLWNQFKYQSKHSRKMSAVYFALLFDLESKQDDFDKNAFQIKIKTLYEQNSFRRNKNFLCFSGFQYYLLNDFSELEDYARYFSLIIQRLKTEVEKNLFATASAYFVENFKEMENLDLKITVKINRI